MMQCTHCPKTVWKSRFTAREASFLSSLHILRLLEGNQQVPNMDYTFFSQCMLSIANLAGKVICKYRNPALLENLRQYQALQTEVYHLSSNFPALPKCTLWSSIKHRRTLLFNTILTLLSRLTSWFQLRIK